MNSFFNPVYQKCAIDDKPDAVFSRCVTTVSNSLSCEVMFTDCFGWN